MNQEERLDYLVRNLCEESGRYKNISVQGNERRMLLRSLMNVRPPKPISREFLQIQDEFLQEEAREKQIALLSDIPTVKEAYGIDGAYYDRLSIWQGDITQLAADAIINAANSQMLGCFVPCHSCIDNAIHSAAGLELREECARIMKAQGHEEPVGCAKITKGYNLPAKHVIHTVGPTVYGRLTEENRESLASCYRSCLELAEANHLKSIAFCCISTGVFHFPNDIAAEIAVSTVLEHLSDSGIERVIFNVFKDEDKYLYENVLKKTINIPF